MGSPILPGATLGVLGGGQLGRMFCAAANRMGYAVAALDPDPDAPALQVAQHPVAAELDDPDALGRIAGICAAVTVEFENVPKESLAALAEKIPTRPCARAISVAQNRAAEKQFAESLGIPPAPHAIVRGATDLASAPESLYPGRLKSLRFGYDGKGQHPVASREEAERVLGEHPGTDFVLEKNLDLAAEVAMIGARLPSGEIAFLPPCQTFHADGILDVAIAPAPLDPAVTRQARESTRRVLEALEYEGVLCVEYFITRSGDLMLNEMAPRPHNSGHHSIESCSLSQFELQVRALCGLPVGDPVQAPHAAMLNLLGQCWEGGEPDWAGVLRDPRAALHLYGKREPRRGRKMGHVTFLADDARDAERRALEAKSLLYPDVRVRAGQP